MHAYLELLSIRMGKRLIYTLDLPKDLENFEIAPMLLQPLVENAIKHGLEPKLKGGSLNVSALLENGFYDLKSVIPDLDYRLPMICMQHPRAVAINRLATKIFVIA